MNLANGHCHPESRHCSELALQTFSGSFLTFVGGSYCGTMSSSFLFKNKREEMYGCMLTNSSCMNSSRPILAKSFIPYSLIAYHYFGNIGQFLYVLNPPLSIV